MAKDGVFDELSLANKKLQITQKSIMVCNMKTSIVNTIIYRICARMFSRHKNITRKFYDLIYKTKVSLPEDLLPAIENNKSKIKTKIKNFYFNIFALSKS